MENYIYELYKRNEIIKLENAIERAYPQFKASIIMAPSQRQLYIALTDRKFHFVKAYIAEDFNCKPTEQRLLPYQLDNLPQSKTICDDESFRKFYLRFMNNNFETYKTDYKAYINEQAEKDLNESVTI